MDIRAILTHSELALLPSVHLCWGEAAEAVSEDLDTRTVPRAVISISFLIFIIVIAID